MAIAPDIISISTDFTTASPKLNVCVLKTFPNNASILRPVGPLPGVTAKGFAEDDELCKAIAFRIVQALRLQWKRGQIDSSGKRTDVRVLHLAA